MKIIATGGIVNHEVFQKPEELEIRAFRNRLYCMACNVSFEFLSAWRFHNLARLELHSTFVAVVFRILADTETPGFDDSFADSHPHVWLITPPHRPAVREQNN